LKHFLLIFTSFLFISILPAQNTFKAVVESDEEEPDLLEGATANVIGTQISAIADTDGFIILRNIPNGEQTIEFSYLGYFRKKVKINFPQPAGTPVTVVRLQSQEQEVKEVVISTTRNYQNAEYIPTRVEVIDDEEVEERSHDKPSDISHILQEQPGVQIQRTSATSGTLSIRLEGLNSDYTQILRDGFPVYGGLSNLTGVTQISPLDIQQMEIIKGPSSILYGSDAIAGVINLVSKVPTEKPVYDIMLNAESAQALDAGIFASQKFKWLAFTLTGSYRDQREKSWDTSQFTQTPKLQRYSISPKIFFDISRQAKLDFGVNYTYENRLGGALPYVEGLSDTGYYYEKNISRHFSTELKFEYDFGDNGKLTFRNSVNLFDRTLTLPYYLFKGQQVASASEVNYRFIHQRHDAVFGLDYRTDRFTEAADSAPVPRNYFNKTIGLFAQYMYHLDENTTLEAGLRFDYLIFNRLFALPHVGALHRWNGIFSTRLNVGMGYRLPTIFQDESEEVRFMNVLPIASSVNPESSIGGTIDLKVKLPSFGGFNLTIYQLYFLTHILQPLIADTSTIAKCPTGDCYTTSYQNGNGYVQAVGIENGILATYRGFAASVIYTLTDNHQLINEVQSVTPLTSKHIITLFADYEIKNFFIGIDAYYYSPPQLSDGSLGHQIWEVGINSQYAFKFLIIFANLENIANIRQTSYGNIVFPNPTYYYPRFAEIYGPLEGRLLNVGVKIRLGAFIKGSKNEGVERMKNKVDD